MDRLNIYEETVAVTCTNNNKTVICKVDSFKPNDILKVFYQVDKVSFDIIMKYNSTNKLFVGNAAKLEFTAPAPKVVGWQRR